MKRISHLLLSAALLFSFACTRDGSGVSPDEGNPDGHKVSVEAALADLQTVLGQIDGQTRGGSSRSVASVCAVKAADMLSATRSGELPDVEDLVYIANFENGEGYAILGADDRLESVIAVTEQGSLTPEELAAAANGGDGDLSESPVIPEIINYITGGWTGGIDGPPILPPMYYTYYCDWVMTARNTPFITVKWNQEKPYNIFCPAVPGKEHGYVGCSAVAIGQIVAMNAFWTAITPPEYFGGSYIDWDMIHQVVKLSYQGTQRSLSYNDESPRAEAVATYLRAIGAAVEMKYYDFGSMPDSYDTILSFFKSMGYRNVRLETYSIDRVYAMLVSERLPVYVGADNSNGRWGHEWVIDGVVWQKRNVEIRYISSDVVSSTTVENRYILHCNFGYNGAHDGYYVSGVFDLKKGPEMPDKEYGDRIGASENNFSKNIHIITYTY